VTLQRDKINRFAKYMCRKKKIAIFDRCLAKAYISKKPYDKNIVTMEY